MSNSTITRPVVKQRLNNWVKLITADPAEEDLFPETALLDKARIKLLHRPTSRRKEKIWYMECQWISEEDYNEYSRAWWRADNPYNTDWGFAHSYGEKFISLTAAQNNFRSRRPGSRFDNVSGRNWRIRNIKTGEIYLLQ